MFSCRQAVRRTFDMLERRLSPAERTGSLEPSRALSSLPRAFAANPRPPLRPQTQDNLAHVALPRLCPTARARIAAAVVDANHPPES